MKIRRKQALLMVLLTVSLAACGKVGDLEPHAGQTMPAKAYGQTEAASAEALTAPSVQARPGRSDELMRRSERRQDDPFDVPPGTDLNDPVPQPPATPVPDKKPN